jgi:hypothetical protein
LRVSKAEPGVPVGEVPSVSETENAA